MLLSPDANRGLLDRKSEEKRAESLCYKHTQSHKPQQRYFWCSKKQVVQFVYNILSYFFSKAVTFSTKCLKNLPGLPETDLCHHIHKYY